jgi:F0F1-type ATP synthase membrane subunit b/b'
MEKSISKKPIEEISASIKEIKSIVDTDIKQIREDLAYIKSKIKEEQEKEKDEDIVEVKKSWWF